MERSTEDETREINKAQIRENIQRLVGNAAKDFDPVEDMLSEFRMTQEMKTYTSGAKSTVKKPRYDLVEQRGAELIAGRMQYGAERHGPRNYRKGATDEEFITDRINHLIEHCMAFAEFRRTSDLAAIGANFNILAGIGADRLRDGADGKQNTTKESE